MRIVFVDTTLQGPLIGGAQTFLPLLIKGLTVNGHEVHLIASATPDKRVATAIETCGAILHTKLWKKNLLVEDAAIVLSNWINAIQPDVYVVSVSPDIGWVVLPYLDPAIATLTIGHTDSETFYAPVRHYKSFLTKAIAVSDQVSEQYISSCGLLPEQVQWIPYGVNVSTALPKENDQAILKLVYVGRLEEEQKRISDIAAVIKLLSAKKLSYHFTIIGDGPEMAKLTQLLAPEIENNNVKFCGWLSNDKVVEVLKQSDVFVLTSAYEGFCIALVEAMANGCCPVVTNIRSGNKQLITDGENGFLLEIGNVDAFATHLSSLQQDRMQLENMRLKAWQKAKEYNVPNMVTAYTECFKDAVVLASKHMREIKMQFPIMASCKSSYPQWMRRLKKIINV